MLNRNVVFLRFRVSALIAFSLLLVACGGGANGGGGSPPVLPYVSFTVPSPIYIYPNTPFTLNVTANTNTSATPQITSIQVPSGITTTTSFPMAVPSGGVAISFQVSPTLTDGNYTLNLSGSAGSATNSEAITTTLQTHPYPFILTGPGLFNEIGVPIGNSGQMQFETSSDTSSHYDIQLSLSGLPPGTHATITPSTISPLAVTTVTITADSTAAPAQNVAVTLTGTPIAPVAANSTTFLVDVSPPPGSLPNNRTDYVSTEGTPYAAVYDPLHNLIFSTNPSWNRVDVISSTTHAVVDRIPIREPRGIDITQDSSTVWVASGSRYMYAINPASFAVTKYLLPTGNKGYWEGSQLLALSNGSLMIVLTQGTYLGSSGLAVWNPETDAISFPTPLSAMDGNVLSRSGDGKRVYLVDSTSAGRAYYYDVPTQQFSSVTTLGGYGLTIAVNVDSTRLAICDANGPNMYDGTFNRIGALPSCGFGTDPFFEGGSVFSSDNLYLYQEVPSQVPVIAKIDPNTLNILSVAPALPLVPVNLELSSIYYLPNPFGVDSTGTIFGIEDWGIAFDDAAFVQNFSILQPGTSGLMQHMSPYFGPLAGGTASNGFGGSFTMFPDVWYGTNRGTAKNPSYLTITSPRGNAPGPVNLKLLFPDGSEYFDPLFFSYGPYLQYPQMSGSAPQGGAPAQIVGYGLARDNVNGTLTVGGTSAALVAPGDLGLPWANTPFPNKVLSYTVPSGKAGWADITLTTTDGSSTVPKGMFYAKSVTDYSSSDTFSAVLYDESRQQLYLSAGDHIDVFSLTSNQFESPLTPPSVQGSSKLFGGLALTPDGSLLLAGDLADASLAVINPDSPGGSYAIPVGSPTSSSCWIGPRYIAPTSDNRALVVSGSMPGICLGGGEDYVVDLASHAVGPMQSGNCRLNPTYIAASGDGSKIAMGGSGIGTFCIYDVASNTYRSNGAYQQDRVAFSSDGNVAASALLLTDSVANSLGHIAQPNVLYPTPATYYSNPQFNAAGSLFYIAYPNFVDIIDVQHALLRMRFSLTETIPTLATAVAMSVDSDGRFIFLITDKGLTIVDLGAAPLSIGWLNSSVASPGSLIAVRGSGFDSSTSATVAGHAAVVSVTDPSTLTLTVPAVSAGPASIVLTNGDGVQYIAPGLLTIQ